MRTEPLPRGRATIRNLGQAIQVVIPARRRLGVALFLMVWLGGWLVGEVTTVGHLLHDGGPKPPRGFLFFWLAGWSVGGAFAATSLGWVLFGRETITADAQALAIRYEVLGIGRGKRYDLANVKDLRVAVGAHRLWDEQRSVLPSALDGGLAFDYGARTIRFAISVDEAEAKDILDRLTENNSWLRRSQAHG